MVVFVLIDFLDNLDFVSNQVNELENIKQAFFRQFQNNTRYVLVGHSKGGLVANSFVSINHANPNRRIDRIFSFDTPYIWTSYYMVGQVLPGDRTIGSQSQMDQFLFDWRLVPVNDRPPVTALSTWPSIVPNSSALGDGHRGFHPWKFEGFERIQGSFGTHTGMLDNNALVNIIFDRIL